MEVSNERAEGCLPVFPFPIPLVVLTLALPFGLPSFLVALGGALLVVDDAGSVDDPAWDMAFPSLSVNRNFGMLAVDVDVARPSDASGMEEGSGGDWEAGGCSIGKGINYRAGRDGNSGINQAKGTQPPYNKKGQETGPVGISNSLPEQPFTFFLERHWHYRLNCLIVCLLQYNTLQVGSDDTIIH